MTVQTLSHETNFYRGLVLAMLIVAGEAVFFLPFVLPRIFRPTYLETFQLTNLQLGTAFSLYGVVAMISYLAGGPLADRYSARKLMTIALFTTAAGGFVLTLIPTFWVVVLLYGFWGLTSILLFWAALLRATREWGGEGQQGMAYGFLDGGRGLIAALLGSVSVAIFASMLPQSLGDLDHAHKSAAFSRIIWIFTGLVSIVACLVWFIIPDSKELYRPEKASRFDFSTLSLVTRMPSIWLQAIIVLCAYVGYKCTDDFSLYAYDAFGYSDVDAAKLGTVSYWVRPLVAVAAGLLADRYRGSHIISLGFLIMFLGALMIGLGIARPGSYWMLAMVVVTISIGIYALRAIYFALFQESMIPFAVTGTAVGVVSVVGYTPDIFMGPVMGYLIDNYPGAEGHQYLFLLLCVFAAIGLICSIWFARLNKV